jgi:hypothetical protein
MLLPRATTRSSTRQVGRRTASAEAIKAAQRGGIALAKAKEGDRKPSFTHRQLSIVRDMDGQGVGEIAKATG